MATSDRHVPAAGSQTAAPRALIVTIYGLYARACGGWLSVAALIRLMAAVGADEPAVRSSISRLKQRGIVEPRKTGGAAGYALSPRGTQILAEGDWRIFGRPRAQAADGWLLAVFSVPEAQRRRRHALRSLLSWLGFGTVSAGVWIAPGQLAAETIDVLRRHDLTSYVDLFRADYLAFGAVGDLLPRWWDLDRLAREYTVFHGEAQAVLDRWPGPPAAEVPARQDIARQDIAVRDTAGRSIAGQDIAGQDTAGRGILGQDTAVRDTAGQAALADEQAFADYVRVLTGWRRLPFLDPGLPAELLPATWPGLDAEAAFAALHNRLAGPAREHVLAVTGSQPPGRPVQS